MKTIIPKIAKNQLNPTMKCLSFKCQKTFKTKQGLGSQWMKKRIMTCWEEREKMRN